MQRFLFLSKIIIAAGFLLVAYLFLTDKDLLGVEAEVLLVIISLVGFIILLIDQKNKSKR